MPSSPSPSELAVDITRRLIRFDTVSAHSNLPLIEWVEHYLRSHGVRSRLSFDADRGKANLFATIGPQVDGGVVLSGHTDTVPVGDERWTKAPFDAVIAGGKLFGRGAADMKAFIGVCLAWVPSIKTMALTRPIHLALTFDEETSMLGVRTLIADLRETGIAPAFCLVGEPTELKVVVGHKGRRALRCCVRGKSAHSSVPSQGVNAVEHAARIVSRVRRLAERCRLQEPRHYGYDVPHSTVVTTGIRGGSSANTVPAECLLDFEIRHLPWTDVDALEAQIRRFAEEQVLAPMTAAADGCDLGFETLCSYPAFEALSNADDGKDPAVSQLLEMLGHSDAPLGYMSFGTEATWFRQAGIATVICGPGSIEQAHKPDEFVTLEQIAGCERLLEGLLRSEALRR